MLMGPGGSLFSNRYSVRFLWEYTAAHLIVDFTTIFLIRTFRLTIKDSGPPFASSIKLPPLGSGKFTAPDGHDYSGTL